jgi:hypothetical protein
MTEPGDVTLHCCSSHCGFVPHSILAMKRFNRLSALSQRLKIRSNVNSSISIQNISFVLSPTFHRTEILPRKQPCALSHRGGNHGLSAIGNVRNSGAESKQLYAFWRCGIVPLLICIIVALCLSSLLDWKFPGWGPFPSVTPTS